MRTARPQRSALRFPTRACRAISCGRPSTSAARARRSMARANQFAGSQTENRVVFTVGKFAATDIFDKNKYATDPRNDFLNWALVDTGDIRLCGRRMGLQLWRRGRMVSGRLDACVAACSISPSFPTAPNSTRTSSNSNGWAKSSAAISLFGHTGKIAVTGFLSRGRMGTFRGCNRVGADHWRFPAISPPSADIGAAGPSPTSNRRSHPTLGFSPVSAGPTAMSSPMSSPTSTARWRPACS